jgi:hypothetical protein
MASNGRMTNGLMRGNGRGLLYGVTLVFAWKKGHDSDELRFEPVNF